MVPVHEGCNSPKDEPKDRLRWLQQPLPSERLEEPLPSESAATAAAPVLAARLGPNVELKKSVIIPSTGVQVCPQGYRVLRAQWYDRHSIIPLSLASETLQYML